MIVLGLLFILLAALAGTWLYLALMDMVGDHTVDFTALGVTIGFSPMALLLIGFGLACALGIGLYLIRAGISAGARRRRARKELEREAAENQRASEAAAAERLRAERAAADERGRSITDPVNRTDSVNRNDAGWTPGDGRR